jgi:pimeloyl-ACP methyl ester carboxylesterase
MVWPTALFAILGLFIWVISGLKQARWIKSHPATGQFVVVDGKNLHYIKIGTGPPLVMLHGAGGNLRNFTFSLTDQLKENFTIYAFDRPGHGYSDVFDQNGETLSEQARIITKGIQTLGVENATVLGYSMGGAVAMMMALDYPDNFHGVVLLAAAIHTWPDESVSLTYRAAALPIIGPILMHTAHAVLPDSYFANSYAGVFTPQSAPDGFLDHVGVGLTVQPHRFVANARQIVPLLPQIKNMIPRYDTLKLPMEIIHGTADQTVGSEYHTRDFMDMQPRPNVRATYVDGLGHGIDQLAQPEIISALKRLSKLRDAAHINQ